MTENNYLTVFICELLFFQVIKYDFKAKCVFLALMVRRVILACSNEVRTTRIESLKHLHTSYHIFR